MLQAAWDWLCFWARFLWFLATRCLHRNLVARAIPRSSMLRHKVLVLGDEHAEGYGDYIVAGANAGLAARLKPFLDEDVRLLHRWHLVNAGVYGARTRDWLPRATRRPACARTCRRTSKTLWKDVMDAETSRMADAEVVVVLLGSRDVDLDEEGDGLGADKSQETVDNLVELAEALVEREKEVFICTLPPPLNAGALFTQISRRNKLLRNAFDTGAFPAERCRLLTAPEDAKLFRGEMRSADSFHFSSRGYKRLARSIAEDVIIACVRVEAVWKRSLFKRSS